MYGNNKIIRKQVSRGLLGCDAM